MRAARPRRGARQRVPGRPAARRAPQSASRRAGLQLTGGVHNSDGLACRGKAGRGGSRGSGWTGCCCSADGRACEARALARRFHTPQAARMRAVLSECSCRATRELRRAPCRTGGPEGLRGASARQGPRAAKSVRDRQKCSKALARCSARAQARARAAREAGPRHARRSRLGGARARPPGRHPGAPPPPAHVPKVALPSAHPGRRPGSAACCL